MRDPDAMMAYEARQQELCRRIARELREDDEKDYFLTSISSCQMILRYLAGDRSYGPTKDIEPILEPICAFTERPAEREFLLLKVYEVLFATVSSSFSGAWLREQLAMEFPAHERA